MKTIKLVYLFIFSITFFISCDKNEIDTEKPAIDLSIQGAFPVNCDTLYFGDTFEFKALLSDNVELGSLSIDIHHNFDHHSHTTEVTECTLDPIKTPVNSFLLIEDFNIPVGQTAFESNFAIYIPAENSNGIYDKGDYHFFISLVDKQGWAAQKGLSIKMLHH
jgi:hypothetical protein